jgi:porin-like protein
MVHEEGNMISRLRAGRRLLLGTAASLATLAGAEAADLPVKAKAVEYVKVCSLYGAGFYYIPGTDTCIRMGGSIRMNIGLNGSATEFPPWQGGSAGANSYNRNYFNTYERFNLLLDTRTNTEYGTLRTFYSALFQWFQGRDNIAGGYVENDFMFIQFAGFTFGKAVSMFDPQWALSKPLTSSSFIPGSNQMTGLPMLAYTASFGDGWSATVGLEDAQPYRSSGVVNTSNPFLGPFGSNSLAPTYGTATNSFVGNAQIGDHVPDIVANLRLDQAWGSVHVAAAAHEVHGTYYTAALSDSGKPDSTWGYAVTGAFELKNLPTGVGDSFKVEGSFANGAPRYNFGNNYDGTGAGRFAKANGQTLAFGYVLDGVYANGTQIFKSNSWDVEAYYEHYWNPAWRTSLFGGYAHISYGAGGNALLLAAATGGLLNSGFVTATGDFSFGILQVGTRTAWTPVKDLQLAAQFTYDRINQNLNGTATLTGVPGYAAASTFTLKSQNAYSGTLDIVRSF